MPRVIVIGAGISGLAFTKTYLQLSNYYTSFSLPKPVDKLAPPTDKSSIPKSFTSSLSLSNPLIPTETHDIIIVDENLSLGGSWCRSRIYPNLYTQNALGTYEFSDMPLEGEGVANEAGYIAGWKLEEYLARWSEKWELTEKMRFGIKVNTICRDPTTHEWILDTNRNPPPEHLSRISEDVGRQLRLYCDKLVLAVGTSSEPNKPYIPGQEFIDDGDMVHSVELGDWCRRNLGIDVNYHHEPSVRPLPKPGVISGDEVWGSLENPNLKGCNSSVVVTDECLPPPPPPPPPVTTPIPAIPQLPPPPRTIAIYGGRKSAFDIVYFFATLPEHLRPTEIHWIFRPSASTPSRFAAPFVGSLLPWGFFQAPDWLKRILPMPSIPIRMDELMAVRLVGLFERCGFGGSVAGASILRTITGMIPGMGRVFGKQVKSSSDVLGLRGRGWAGRLLQETKLGQSVVEGLWCVLDKAWEAVEGVGKMDNGDIYKLRPETSSGSCTTSFLITNQPGFWDIIWQPNIHIHRTGIQLIARYPEQDSVDSQMQIQLDDGTHISEIELLIMATGWKTSFPSAFNPPVLPAKLGLPYEHSTQDGRSSSEVQTEVNEIIKHWKSLEPLAQQRLGPKGRINDLSAVPRDDLSPGNVILPLRLFRNMVSPELTTSRGRDRSLLVLGMAKSWHTMIVSEVQALWGTVYLFGGFDKGEGNCLDFTTLGKDGIEERIAVFEEFSKRTGGGALLVDSLKYCDTLLRDLGLNPWRKSMGGNWWSRWRDLVGVYRPEDYAGIVGEWMGKNNTAGEDNT